MLNPGFCPQCGTSLDFDEIMICDGQDWFEAYCSECNRYMRKKLFRDDKIPK